MTATKILKTMQVIVKGLHLYYCYSSDNYLSINNLRT